MKIHTFGCPQEQYEEVKGTHKEIDWQEILHHGVLNRKEIYTKLKDFHIFVDLSRWQAFGFTALEGMSVGVVPVIPDSSGLSNYIVLHRQTGLTIKGNSSNVVNEYVSAVMSLCTNRHFFRGLQMSAMSIAREFRSSRTAKSWENQLFSSILDSGDHSCHI